MKPVKDKTARKEWAARHDRCQCCGEQQNAAGWPKLDTHHIIRRSRSDEPCNLLRLCPMCHDLAGGAKIRSNECGGYFPQLTLAMQVALKRLRDPAEADEARLVELRHGEALPSPEDVHWWFLREYERNTRGQRR